MLSHLKKTAFLLFKQNPATLLLVAKSENYISFISDLLKKGIVERKKVLAKFVKKWQVSDRTFDRAWKKAQENHQEYLKKLQTEKDNVSIELEKEAFKQGIIDKNQRMVILSNIALGLIPLKKLIVVDKEIEEREVVPDWQDRKNAIAELNKMDGSYAATKIQEQQLDKDGNPTDPLQMVNKVEITLNLD